MREKSEVGEWSAGLASMTVPDYRFRNSGSRRNSPFLPLPRNRSVDFRPYPNNPNGKLMKSSNLCSEPKP